MTETDRLRAALAEIRILANDLLNNRTVEIAVIADTALEQPEPKTDTRRKLTTRQAEVLAYIRESIASRGCAPTVREIGRHFGVANQAIQGHIQALESKGRLRHEPGVCRTLSVVEAS